MPFRGNTIITTNTKAQLQTGDYHLSSLSSPLPLSSHPAGWRWFQSESWHRQPSPAFALTLPLHEYLHNRKQSVYSVQAQAQGSKWFGSDCCFRYRWLCSNIVLSVCLPIHLSTVCLEKCYYFLFFGHRAKKKTGWKNLEENIDKMINLYWRELMCTKAGIN